MNYNYLLVCLVGVLACFTICTDAILGGQITFLIYYRYMVSLLEVDYGHICGGALIDEVHILTAAHCFINPNNTFKSKQVFALMGTTDLMKLSPPSVNLAVAEIYVPTDYNATDINTTGDIAVLRLAIPVNLANQPFSRAFLERNKKRDYSGQKANFAGWGWNTIEVHESHVTGRRTDSMLRFAVADVLNHHHCQQQHPMLMITENHLCARIEQYDHETRGVCHGDNGGPLVHDNVVIGVLSKHITNCAERTSPAIYTRVSHYLTFIRNVKEYEPTRNMRIHRLRS